MSKWGEREINIAKQLVEPEVLAFLEQIFVKTKTNAHDKFKAKFDDSNEQYGAMMKVLHMTNEENKARMNLIHKIAKQKPEGEQKPSPKIAPR